MTRNTGNGRPAMASIGFFDGVHKGHMCLVNQLCEEAARRDMSSLLVTFDRHPRTVVSPGHVPQLLTTLEEKESLLRRTGVDRIAVLPFTKALSELSARDFMEQVLQRELGVKALMLGYDHVFGHGGGSNDDFVQWGKEIGMEIVRAQELADQMVSSSKCRKLLEEGRVERAASMLGRYYSLSGEVVKGFHVGHELGFPTANLRPHPEKLIPARGVYAVWVTLADGSRHAGMLNIGNRPTLENGEEMTVEVNVFDYDGNLYGQRVGVEFVEWLRAEQRFDSREELMAQLAQDAKEAASRLKAEV